MRPAKLRPPLTAHGEIFMTVTEPTTTTESELAKAKKWAEDYQTKVAKAANDRLNELASQNGSATANDTFRPAIGEPTVGGTYVAFDIAATSPLQFTALPPYQPSKVIAAGESAFLIAFLWVNPATGPGFVVPPAVQLGGRGWRVTLDLANITTMTATKLVETGTFGPIADAAPGFAIFSLPTSDPGLDPDLYEANLTFDITDPAQPYAAFATNFFDVDADPGFLFVPPSSSPQWRNDAPNRYLVYRK